MRQLTTREQACQQWLETLGFPQVLFESLANASAARRASGLHPRRWWAQFIRMFWSISDGGTERREEWSQRAGSASGQFHTKLILDIVLRVWGGLMSIKTGQKKMEFLLAIAVRPQRDVDAMVRAETGYSVAQLRTMIALDPAQANTVIAAAQAVPTEQRERIRSQAINPYGPANVVPFRQGHRR
jgi:hypothetical protein